MKRPNFFIVGASRCGTTSMYRYLKEHPAIFMPLNKEPRFFCDDQPHPRRVTNLSDYLALFVDATNQHSVIGEASTTYIYSHTAIGRIREFAPEAKLLVMVRNPVEMAHSLHGQLLFNDVENEPDFEKAWRLQNRRKGWLDIPPRCLCPSFLEYTAFCNLGSQIEKLLEIFPRQQVKFVLFDDLVTDTRTVYEDVLAFLDLPSDGRDLFPRSNTAKQHRSRLLGRLFLYAPLSVRVRQQVRTWAQNLRLKKALQKNNIRPSLSSKFRNELNEVFRDEVAKLSNILDRDLSHWNADVATVLHRTS